MALASDSMALCVHFVRVCSCLRPYSSGVKLGTAAASAETSKPSSLASAGTSGHVSDTARNGSAASAAASRSTLNVSATSSANTQLARPTLSARSHLPRSASLLIPRPRASCTARPLTAPHDYARGYRIVISSGRTDWEQRARVSSAADAVMDSARLGRLALRPLHPWVEHTPEKAANLGAVGAARPDRVARAMPRWHPRRRCAWRPPARFG